MISLTKKQREVYEYIKNYLDRYDYAPSFREIAKAFGFSSVSTVAGYIDALKEKKYLEGENHVARSLQLTPSYDERNFSIPLLGTIAAGLPIEAIRTNETIDVPRDMMGPDVFALRVKGDSMIDDGIFDGDFVIIQRIAQPKNGDIVVSLLDGENVTLKRFYKEKGRIRLQPSNKNYKPIYTDKVTIQGKLRGVIRKFA
ncbi:MAG: repressor LexA [Candidatus Berkelbacteria bacterium Licking1014_85]|uniref:LexA repressor n=1 Tax=Candidatus Berkelbacteria bacterium Licking1014_85 TaxID=2017148 RepID=A0A554LLF9_9BACT|nr:MAG: repressor LexA [Candidatus Berkelbacteria bacterium Licking1014_85]